MVYFFFWLAFALQIIFFINHAIYWFECFNKYIEREKKKYAEKSLTLH